MPGKGHTAEQIIGKLREVEVLVGQGASQEMACRQVGITLHTFYRWRKEYGGLRLDQAKRLKELEQENKRLKKLVADLTLDKDILQEALEGNF